MQIDGSCTTRNLARNMLLAHRTLVMKEIRRQTGGPDQTPTVDTRKDEDQLMMITRKRESEQ